jgi:hypothetical protein
MQLIRAYFEDENTKVLAFIDGFNSATTGIGVVGYNEAVPVFSTPLTIYSGINNPIKISCLNSDQKPINVSNANIQAGLFEPGTQNEVVTANSINIDSANGVVQIIFTPSQTAALDFGMYELALVAYDSDLNALPVYINDFFGSRLNVRLSKGPVVGYATPIPVVYTDQPGIGVVSNQINLTQRPMGSTLATLQANLNMYTGNIIAQGSLVSIPFENDFGNISATYYSNVSGNIFQNVQGSYAVIQFIIDGIDPSRTGNQSSSNIANVINFSSIRI